MEKAQIVLVTLIVYKLVLIGIGIWASRITSDADDFFLGGRGLGPVVAALSYSSSAASAWALLGLSGVAYSYGVSTIWVPLGSITSMFVVWYWIAPRLMSFSREANHLTLTSVLTDGCSVKAKQGITRVASVIIIFSFVFYIAAQFQGAGNTFATTFEMSMVQSIVLGALIIMIYTLLGGFWAVSLTDAIQGLLMVLTALILPVVTYFAVGGYHGLVTSLQASGDIFALSLTGSVFGWAAVGIVIGGLSIGFGTYGQPHLMARIMALRDVKAMRQARRLTVIWYLFVFLGMWFVGLAGKVLHVQLENPETIFFVILDAHLPTVLAAILLAAVLSAIMSTADSQLLSAAAAIAHDLGLGGASNQRFLLVSRISVATLVLISVVVAIYMPDKIFSRVLFAWMALGAAFGPTLFARLANFRVQAKGVFCSIVTGFSLTVVLSFFPNAPGDIAERLAPFVFASLILWLFRTKESSTNKSR